jgi:hypothetical protein
VEVDDDFANFRAVYDELTDEVSRAAYQFIPDHLANWYRALDTSARIATVVRRLEAGVDYRTWRDNLARVTVTVHLTFCSFASQNLLHNDCDDSLECLQHTTVGSK